MDVVDAQVHANVLGTDVTLAIMDALGITGLLFDEYVGVDHDGALHPGYRLPNGTFRSIAPQAEAAALRHPDRFAFLMRVDPLDPGIDCWVETLSTATCFDYTATRERANWGESLFCIRHCPSLSEVDKEWILGRTARRLLNWAPPDSPRAPAPP